MADNNNDNNGTPTRDYKSDYEQTRGRAEKAEAQLREAQARAQQMEDAAQKYLGHIERAVIDPNHYRFLQGVVRGGGNQQAQPQTMPANTGDELGDDALLEMTPEMRRVVRQNQQLASQFQQIMRQNQQLQQQVVQATQGLNTLSNTVYKSRFEQWFDTQFADRQIPGGKRGKLAVMKDIAERVATLDKSQYTGDEEMLKVAAQDYLDGTDALPKRTDLVQDEQAADRAQVAKATATDAVIPSDGADGGQTTQFDFESDDWSSKSEAEKIAALSTADATWIEEAQSANPEGMFS